MIIKPVPPTTPIVFKGQTLCQPIKPQVYKTPPYIPNPNSKIGKKLVLIDQFIKRII